MTADETEYDNVAKYTVVTVDKTQTPDGMTGDSWYEYVIGYGGSRVIGKKPGTLKAVTAHAEAIAEDLNSRAKRGGSTYAPRQNKGKQEQKD